MAKLEKNVTVTVKSGDTETVYKAPEAHIGGRGGGVGEPVLTITLANYHNAGMTTKLKKDEAQEAQTAHERKVAEHAKVILDQIKRAEDTQINAVTKREKLEAEIAEQERADRVALRFAVHAAIQAGVLEPEELTANMRDDHAGYVADMFIKVYEDTDLDSIVNVQED